MEKKLALKSVQVGVTVHCIVNGLLHTSALQDQKKKDQNSLPFLCGTVLLPVLSKVPKGICVCVCPGEGWCLCLFVCFPVDRSIVNILQTSRLESQGRFAWLRREMSRTSLSAAFMVGCHGNNSIQDTLPCTLHIIL